MTPEEFVSSGRAADLVLAAMAIEFAVLLARRGDRPIGAAAMGAALALAPGACLVLALRAALVGEGWPLIAFWVAASLPLHLLDLRRRPT